MNLYIMFFFLKFQKEQMTLNSVSKVWFIFNIYIFGEIIVNTLDHQLSCLSKCCPVLLNYLDLNYY